MTPTKEEVVATVAVPAVSTVRRPSERLLLAGALAGPVFVASAITQMLTREGFDITRHPPAAQLHAGRIMGREPRLTDQIVCWFPGSVSRRPSEFLAQSGAACSCGHDHAASYVPMLPPGDGRFVQERRPVPA
jgi:hypothetical protein